MDGLVGDGNYYLPFVFNGNQTPVKGHFNFEVKAPVRTENTQTQILMPSFVCDHCQETLKKAKLDQHAQRCRNAVFSCIDCYKNFKGTEYREHFSCITEVQKYHVKQGAIVQPPQKQHIKNNLKGNASQSIDRNNKSNVIVIKETQSPNPKPNPKSQSKSNDKITSAIKEILKSKPTANFKIIKKELKKTHNKKEFKKYLQDRVVFTIDPNTSELVLKLD